MRLRLRLGVRLRGEPKNVKCPQAQGRHNSLLDTLSSVWHHLAIMSETENPCSLTRAASMNRLGARIIFLSVHPWSLKLCRKYEKEKKNK